MEVDKSLKYKPSPGMIVHLICRLWEAMKAMWICRNELQYRIRWEDKMRIANEKIHPLVKSVYRTRFLDVSKFSRRLFDMDLKDILQLDSRENERWLEIVDTARVNNRSQEDATLAAIWKLLKYFPVMVSVRVGGVLEDRSLGDVEQGLQMVQL